MNTVKVGDTAQWNTGNQYGPIDEAGTMGQLITIRIVGFGQMIDPKDNVIVDFADHTRGIFGRVVVWADTLGAIQESVLRAYQNSNYQLLTDGRPTPTAAELSEKYCYLDDITTR